jgi:hypothetical protein
MRQAQYVIFNNAIEGLDHISIVQSDGSVLTLAEKLICRRFKQLFHSSMQAEFCLLYLYIQDSNSWNICNHAV